MKGWALLAMVCGLMLCGDVVVKHIEENHRKELLRIRKDQDRRCVAAINEYWDRKLKADPDYYSLGAMIYNGAGIASFVCKDIYK